MNKKITVLLFIVTLICLISTVSAENLTTTDSGTVNGGFYTHAVQNTPYGDQESESVNESVSFNFVNDDSNTVQTTSNAKKSNFDTATQSTTKTNTTTKKSSATNTNTATKINTTTNINNLKTESSNTTSKSFTNISSAKLYTMVYVQNVNTRISSYVNLSVDFDNDGVYETVLENNTLLNISSDREGGVYRLNENITRVYSDYLLYYDIAKYIKTDVVNVKMQTTSAAGYSDGKIKFIGLIVAYNKENSDKNINYWINSGHCWIAEGDTASTTFATAGYDKYDDVSLMQISTSSYGPATTFNGNSIFLNDSDVYFSENKWNVTSLYNSSINSTLTNTASAYGYGSFKTVMATLAITSQALPTNISVQNVTTVSNSKFTLVNEDNNISVILNNTGSTSAPFNVTLYVDDYNSTQQVTSLGENANTTLYYIYNPTTNGTKNVKVIIDYLNGTTTTAYDGTVLVYYNGYMGKSFTNGTNLTTKRIYEGKNTLIIDFIHAYKGQRYKNFTVTYDSAAKGIVDSNKIVDVLYYLPYNWEHDVLNIDFRVNNITQTQIAHYNDTKGYGNWDFPSGLAVYNITSAFKANSNNTFSYTTNYKNEALYGGYVVIIYANNTNPTKILINEGTDLLNPEDSGFGANSSTTLSYANYENIDTLGIMGSDLYSIAGSSDQVNASNVILNGVRYGSIADSYNRTTQISVNKHAVNNLVDGNNTVTLQSLTDNMCIYGTILAITYVDPTVNVTNFTITSNRGSVLALENNTITVTINATRPFTNKINVTLLMGDYSSTITVDSLNSSAVLTYYYAPTTNGTRNVDVIIDYLNGTTTTAYNGTITVYYNGYMGNSFVNKNNMTVRVYDGKNTATIYPVSEYSSGWSQVVSNFNAAENGINDSNKIVEVLFYQGYNWNKKLNILLTVNNQTVTPIASYDDTKGFATYNYPSGVIVYNLTNVFNTNNNVINVTALENNSNVLYPGYLIVIYANNTKNTKIFLAEGADMLNPTSSGYGATSNYTISYTAFNNINTARLNNTVLNTITAAADDNTGSAVLMNNQTYGSLSTTTNNHELSITSLNITNIVNGTNTLQAQATNDNIFVMGSILTLTYVNPTVNVTNFTITSNRGSVLALENNTITVTINATRPFTNKINVTLLMGDYSSTITVDSLNSSAVLTYYYAPTTNGTRNVDVIIDYLNGTTTTAYNGTITVYYNGYMGNSFVNKNNMTVRVYDGKNTATIYPVSEYSSGWSQVVSNFNAAENGINDSNKIVEVLFYQGYNWNKKLNILLTVNNQTVTPIASYDDTKGFATYNYPSGVIVYNLTNVFNTNNNVINVTALENNSNVLYPGYLIVIYANNTKNTKIFLAEGADMLNPTSSGYGATSNYTISYTAFNNINTARLNNTVLNTITAAADDNTGSAVLMNNQTYGSLSTTTNNHELSITSLNITNIVNGTNTLQTQATNDNIFVMGSVLTLTYNDIKNTTITVNTITTTVGKQSSVTVTVKDVTGEKVSNGLVSILVNGKTYTANTTNGTANIKIPVSSLKTGNNILSITYKGNDVYGQSSTTYYINGTKYGPVYYVATNGTSSNNGRTLQTPWNYTYAFNTIRNSIYNNSLIYIINGTYNINSTVLFNNGLTLKVIGYNNAVLNGNNKVINTFNIQNGVLSIEKLTFKNFANTPILNRANNTNITGNTFINNKGTNGGAISIYNANNALVTSNTFQNNTARYGGAIYVRGNNTNINKNTFIKNNANISSGAIYNLGRNTKITNNVFTNNKASTLGGAINNWETITTTITGNKFTGNIANYGGAVYYRGTGLKLNNNNMTSNTACVSGGAVFVIGTSNNITNNNFTSNKAKNGAAINNLGTNTYIQGNMIKYNTANATGAAINNWNAIKATITNNTIHHNQAQYGAIYLRGLNITVSFNNIYSNKATISGGAIFNIGTNSTIYGNTIKNNNAKNYGGAINNWNAKNTRITNNNLTYNNASYGGAINNRGTNTTITENTITGNIAVKGGAILDTGYKTTTMNHNTIKNNPTQNGQEVTH
ncbi:DUF3344 domain-containing protein [uncultured Methanosphaera sp.]|uniref:DUF3344 domain-containing protein n=1 Tax=uncultured Methanosphaera sp. TaxID=262501 RepID=UPI0025CD9085|nr:DUF3344 domain-containing protein [uncultured Methanosphaera sp.]